MYHNSSHTQHASMGFGILANRAHHSCWVPFGSTVLHSFLTLCSDWSSQVQPGAVIGKTAASAVQRPQMAMSEHLDMASGKHKIPGAPQDWVLTSPPVPWSLAHKAAGPVAAWRPLHTQALSKQPRIWKVGSVALNQYHELFMKGLTLSSKIDNWGHAI